MIYPSSVRMALLLSSRYKKPSFSGKTRFLTIYDTANDKKVTTIEKIFYFLEKKFIEDCKK